ncbi:WxL domain-containing protein, partial [Eubacteriales bacterium OttesenSCG-928-A19]|nr:WxL domain-containing protein [Eubacteriales bacterium OttesenSCG-928-A19]
MKKTISLSLMLMLVLTSISGALASDTITMDSTASLSFDDTGALSIEDPETATGFGRKFAKMDIPFGLKDIPLYVQSYPATDPDTAFTNYGIIVADGRGVEDPAWNLTARLDTVFTHEDDTDGTAGTEFNGTITLADGTGSSAANGNDPTVSGSISLPTEGADALVMEGDGLGVGGFYAEWAPEDISLTLGTDFSNIIAGAYTAEMVWTLTP